MDWTLHMYFQHENDSKLQHFIYVTSLKCKRICCTMDGEPMERPQLSSWWPEMNNTENQRLPSEIKTKWEISITVGPVFLSSPSWLVPIPRVILSAGGGKTVAERKEKVCLAMVMVTGMPNKTPNIKWCKHNHMSSTVVLLSWWTFWVVIQRLSSFCPDALWLQWMVSRVAHSIAKAWTTCGEPSLTAILFPQRKTQ